MPAAHADTGPLALGHVEAQKAAPTCIRGGLGTAQRNTAAGVIIAIQNFSDPNVFVMLTLANILGIVMLLILARFLSRDNKVKLETL